MFQRRVGLDEAPTLIGSARHGALAREQIGQEAAQHGRPAKVLVLARCPTTVLEREVAMLDQIFADFGRFDDDFDAQ